MNHLLKETKRRREVQAQYNCKNKITPRSVYKSTDDVMHTTAVANSLGAGDSNSDYLKRDKEYLEMDTELALDIMRKEMLDEADNMNFERAAILRDQIKVLEEELKSISKTKKKLKNTLASPNK